MADSQKDFEIGSGEEKTPSFAARIPEQKVEVSDEVPEHMKETVSSSPLKHSDVPVWVRVRNKFSDFAKTISGHQELESPSESAPIDVEPTEQVQPQESVSRRQGRPVNDVVKDIVTERNKPQSSQEK